MKVLWVVNAPIPLAAEALGVPAEGFPTWVEAAHNAVVTRADVEVSIAFPRAGKPRRTTTKGASFATFRAVEFGREREAAPAIADMIRRMGPDLVHVFGTEGGHAQVVAEACTRMGVPFVVGLQGLSSTIGQHYTSGLPAVVTHGFTLRDVVRRDNIARQAAKYRRWGEAEGRTLRLARYVIGRTTWDKAVSQQWNPEARYFLVPETLRPTFYAKQWSLENCQPHSIFVSQGHYPIKGLHFVLRALPAIVERQPDTQVLVGGWPIRSSGVRGWLKQTRYSTYVARLAQRLGLEDRVHFVGVLNEANMAEQFLRSHVFVTASTVENESNSLSEAKLLGVPVVASYVGGVADRVEHGTTGFFYQHDAPYMLAHYVSKLFSDPSLCRRFSTEERAASMRLNDATHNAQLLCDAYDSILEETSGYVREL